MIKVAFISNNYTPFQGGVVSSIQAFCKGLQERGVNIRLYTLDFGTQEADLPFVTRLFCPLKFSYKKNHMAVPLLARQQLRLAFQSFKPDLLHVHHPFLLGKAAAHIGKKLQIPTVFTYHTQYDQYVHYMPLPKQMSKHLVTARVHHFCSKMTHVIAPSYTIHQMVREQINTPMSVIPSPLQEIFLHLVQPVKQLAKPYRLLCVSRFTHEKQLHQLIDAFALLPMGFAQLELIGYGYLESELRAYAQEKMGNRAHEITFTIAPEKQYIRYAYEHAHLFIFSSVNETQGLVLAESMAAGTPVIAFSGPGSDDIIQHGKNGYLVTGAEEMAQQIVQTLEDHTNYQMLSKNAFETAQNYTPDTCAAKLKALYEQLI